MIETYKHVHVWNVCSGYAEYIKPDKSFTRAQVKERKINEEYQATILQQQDTKLMEYVAC